MRLAESLDNALDYIVTDENDDFIEYTFNLKEEFNLNLKIVVGIEVIGSPKSTMIVNFKALGLDNELSTEKKASFAIFATLVEILDEARENNNAVHIEATGDTFKKNLIYEKLFKRFTPENWDVFRHGRDVIAQKKS